jgi:hypothetical protein
MYRPTATISEVDISLGIVQNTVNNQLDYKKCVHAACQINSHMIIKLSVGLLTCLTHYVDQAEHFPQCTVMGDDVGLSHIQNQNSIHEMQTPISPPAKKCETIQLVEKIMAIVILDHKCMPIVDFPGHGDTIIAEYYSDTHERSQQACITKGLNCCLKAS